MIGKPDLDAICDVLAQLYNEAEGMSAEQAISRLGDVNRVKAALAAAVSELETTAVRQMEGPILVGNVVWSKVRDVKRRPDHMKIDGRVVGLASVDRDTGELLSAMAAAEQAVGYMRSLYVSPATMPKAGGLKEVGLGFDQISDEEFVGWKLRQQEVKE